MKIRVNGKDIVFTGKTVSDLVGQYELDDFFVVERNKEIVHRESYQEVDLVDGDIIEIVSLAGGG